MATTATVDFRNNNNNIEVSSTGENLNSVRNVTNANNRSPPNPTVALTTGALRTGTLTTGHTLGGSGLPRILHHLDNEEPSSLGSMIYDEEYHEDPLLDLTLGSLQGDYTSPENLQEDYADPSMDYVFVSSIFSEPCLDNTEALLKQLQDMGVRVNEDYLNLDFDLTMSRSNSVGSYSGPESLEDESDSLKIASLDKSINNKRPSSFSHKIHPIFSINSTDDADSLTHTDPFEDEFAEAEILPNGGGVKVTYENYKKDYRSRVTPIKNYVKYLELTPEEEEAPEFTIEEASSYDEIGKNNTHSENLKCDKDTTNTLDERCRRAVAAFSKRMSMKLDNMGDEISGLRTKCSLNLKLLLAEQAAIEGISGSLPESNTSYDIMAFSYYLAHLDFNPAEEITYDTVTPDSGVHETFNALSPEEQEKQREEWKSELVKTEEEIQTLRQVLNSKVKHAQDLKRRLGITVWREFTDDFNASMKSVRESQTLQQVQSSSVYQKTAGAMGAVGEKTAGLFGGISAKFGAIKENPTFKSFEERVGGVVASAKGQPGETAMGSGSNSTQDFNQMQEGDKTGMEANGQTTLAGTDINQPAS